MHCGDNCAPSGVWATVQDITGDNTRHETCSKSINSSNPNERKRFYPLLAGNCFESVYLGVNILPRNKNMIIKLAKKLNPEIKIYQMTIDPEAFKMKTEIIES